MKLYKYTSVSSATKIIKSSSVILNNPEKFNDPFDSNIFIKKENKKEAFDLIYNFYLYKNIKNVIDNKNIKFRQTQRQELLLIKSKCNSYEKSILNNMNDNEYNKNLLEDILKLFEKFIPKKFIPNFKELKDNLEKESNKIIDQMIYNIKSKLLITCFSKKNDSILMWSHYGDSHKGVCFEFEEDRDIFKEVKYTDERSKLNLKKLVERYLMCEFKNEECDLSEDEYQKSIIEQFFTKQNDWSYEQEIRCVLSKDNTSLDDFYYENGNYFLKMKIKKIYIGSKASGETLNDLISRALKRKIEVVFMKEDEDYFKIIPDYDKKPNLRYPTKTKISDFEMISSEINICLDSECYLSALNMALIIPSIIGKIMYPDLSEKEAYIKWYQENIGKYDAYKENTPEIIPYPSGELIFELKWALQTNFTTSIKEKHEDFNLSKLELIAQGKSYYGFYSNGASYDNEKAELQINIRDTCYKILNALEKELVNHPEISNRCLIELRNYDKELDRLNELSIQNNQQN